MSNELQTVQSHQLAAPSAVPVTDMLTAILKSGVTEANMAVIERMMALQERALARDAEQAFAAAFAALQAETPTVRAVKPVPDKNGNIKYHYAPYEDIMEQVRPLLQKHGFTVTFSSEIKDERIHQVCTLQHINGHKRSNTYMGRIGGGPPGASPTQADGAAATYCKRQALCDALNIVVDRDTDGASGDARSIGKPIKPDQAIYLRELVRETGSDEARFLKFAGASTYEEIGSDMYEKAAALLHSKLNKR